MRKEKETCTILSILCQWSKDCELRITDYGLNHQSPISNQQSVIE